MTTIAARERRLADWIAPWIPRCAAVVDVGAGSGLLAQALAQTLDARITLVDIVDNNRSHLPLTLYDGTALPFSDRSFAVALLSFSLHHSTDPRRTFREACRVAERVVILEDAYRSRVERLAARWTDWIVNRGHGVAPAWGQLRPEQWVSFVEGEPVRVVHMDEAPPRWIGRHRDPIRHVLIVADGRQR